MEMTPVYTPGEAITAYAVANVPAGAAVALATAAQIGATVIPQGSYAVVPCAAGQRPFGVAQTRALAPAASHDPRALTTVTVGRPVVRGIPGAAIDRGADLTTLAGGEVGPADGVDDLVVGQACLPAADADPFVEYVLG